MGAIKKTDSEHSMMEGRIADALAEKQKERGNLSIAHKTGLLVIIAAIGLIWFSATNEYPQSISKPVTEQKMESDSQPKEEIKSSLTTSADGEAMLIMQKAEELERQDYGHAMAQLIEALSPKYYVTGEVIMLQERPKKPFVVNRLSNGMMQIQGWVQLKVNHQPYKEVWLQNITPQLKAAGVEHLEIERHVYPSKESGNSSAQQHAALLEELKNRSVPLAMPEYFRYRLTAFAEQCKRWKNVLFILTGDNTFTAFNAAHPMADLYGAFVKDISYNISKATVQVHLLDQKGEEIKTIYVPHSNEQLLYRPYAGDAAMIVAPEFFYSEHERYGQVSVNERLLAFSAELKQEELARVSSITVSMEMPQVSQERIMQYAEHLRKAAAKQADSSSQTETPHPPQPEPPVAQKPTPAPQPVAPLQPGATQVNLSGLGKQHHQNEAAVPAVKALYEQLSPAACLTGNLVQLSDNQFFRLQKMGSQTELSTWVELKVDPAKYMRLAWLIHEHMKHLPHQTQERHAQAVPQGIVRSSRRELNGCETGDFADTSKLQPHYAFDPKLFANLHALYLCTSGETFTAYDLSAAGQKTPYMLEMLRLQRQKPQQYIVQMHFLNAHNEEVATISRLLDLYYDKFNAPLYAGGQQKAPSMVVLPEFSSFLWGNFTPGSSDPHLVTYPSRIIKISGTINPQDLDEITSVTFSFEWPASLTEQEAQNLAILYTEQKQ